MWWVSGGVKLMVRRVRVFSGFTVVMVTFYFAKVHLTSGSPIHFSPDPVTHRATLTPPFLLILTAFCSSWERTRMGRRLQRHSSLCLSVQSVTHSLLISPHTPAARCPCELLTVVCVRLILQLRGLWVKSGQYMSSRADVFPTPFIKCLQKLQDSVPPSPFEQVSE